MSDHIAGLPLFPQAEIVAHDYFRHTFHLQQDRTAEDDRAFVDPTLRISGNLQIPWGRHNLEVFHNPGKTLCALCVDVADADLVICGDAVVGNTIYLSSSEPGMVARSLARLKALGRRRVVPGHMGVMGQDVFHNAGIYLDNLSNKVAALWRRDGGLSNLSSIAIQDCLAPGVAPTPFETEWHGENLNVIRRRNLYRIGC